VFCLSKYDAIQRQKNKAGRSLEQTSIEKFRRENKMMQSKGGENKAGRSIKQISIEKFRLETERSKVNKEVLHQIYIIMFE